MNRCYAAYSVQHKPDIGLDGELCGPGGLEYRLLGIRNSYPQSYGLVKASGCKRFEIRRYPRGKR